MLFYSFCIFHVIVSIFDFQGGQTPPCPSLRTPVHSLYLYHIRCHIDMSYTSLSNFRLHANIFINKRNAKFTNLNHPHQYNRLRKVTLFTANSRGVTYLCESLVPRFNVGQAQETRDVRGNTFKRSDI